jgi:hypothetical protein
LRWHTVGLLRYRLEGRQQFESVGREMRHGAVDVARVERGDFGRPSGDPMIARRTLSRIVTSWGGSLTLKNTPFEAPQPISRQGEGR